MASSNYSSNDREQHARYTQPISPRTALKLIHEERHSVKKTKLLHDDWNRAEYETRNDAVRDAVYIVAWYVDHDADKVVEVLEDTELFRNWHQGEKEIRMFVETSRVEDPGHYSVYPEDNEGDSTGSSDDDDDDPVPSQNVESVSTRAPLTGFEKRSKEVRTDLF